VSTDLKTILEALLFAAEGPLTSAQLLQVLESSDEAALEAALAGLKADYAAQGRAFELAEVAGGHLLRTRPELGVWIRRLKREQVTKLSRAALETLAIIAYKQPVLKAEIERLRGVEVGGVLRMLMEKDLVRVAGRKDLPGRPLI
jgi:segregation and condensation protein B